MDNERKWRYSFVTEFVTKRSFPKGDANEKQQAPYVVRSFQDESVRAYVPPPLPPDPPLALQPLLALLEQADQALVRLDGLASILPDPSLFTYLYVREEGRAVVTDRGHAIFVCRLDAV
jgi:hypothetical protein